MTTLEGVLAHYGVKGMHWGQRKSGASANGGPTPVVVNTRPGKKVKTAGGGGHGPSEDAVRSAVIGQKARKSTTHALSNKDLQELITRLNLEQQYSRLAPKTASQQVAKFLSETLLGIGKEQATKFAKDTITSQVTEALKRK